MEALVAATERYDNPGDYGVGRDDPEMVEARAALAESAGHVHEWLDISTLDRGREKCKTCPAEREIELPQYQNSGALRVTIHDSAGGVIVAETDFAHEAPAVEKSEPRWIQWLEDLPDWQDIGKRAEFKMEDGQVVAGRLEYEDMTPGPDEHPIIFIKRADGARAMLSDADFWRYIDG